jgi:hypothetical protein
MATRNGQCVHTNRHKPPLPNLTHRLIALQTSQCSRIHAYPRVIHSINTVSIPRTIDLAQRTPVIAFRTLTTASTTATRRTTSITRGSGTRLRSGRRFSGESRRGLVKEVEQRVVGVRNRCNLDTCHRITQHMPCDITATFFGTVGVVGLLTLALDAPRFNGGVGSGGASKSAQKSSSSGCAAGLRALTLVVGTVRVCVACDCTRHNNVSAYLMIV